MKIANLHQRVNVTENVTGKRLSELIRIIAANPKITTTEISKLLEVNRRTIARDIENLKNEGFLKRIGPDNGGHWEVGIGSEES